MVVAPSTSPRTAETVDTMVLATTVSSVTAMSVGIGADDTGKRVLVASPTSTRAVEAVARTVLKRSGSTAVKVSPRGPDEVNG